MIAWTTIFHYSLIIGLVLGCYLPAQSAMINRKEIWPDKHNIPICWYKLKNTKIKSFLEKVAVSEFEKVGIRLTGWGDCKRSYNYPIIKAKIVEYGNRLVNEGGHSKVGPSRYGHNRRPLSRGGDHTLFVRDVSGLLRAEGRRMPKGVQSAIDLFHKCHYLGQKKACRRYPSNSIRIGKQHHFFPTELHRLVRAYLHELGHAVGMRHEHSRYDISERSIPKRCYAAGTRARSSVYRPSNRSSVILYKPGKFDSKAIMSYCHGQQQIHFSAGERKALRTAY